MRIPEVVKNTLVVVVTIVVCLLCLEAGIRIYSALLFPRMMVLDDRLGWRHAPNVSKIFANEDGDRFLVVQNRYGHRGREYGVQKGAGKYRVLVLGDSFTEGVHVAEDDLFSARLEKTDARLEVLNAGVGGYGTVQEYLYFNAEGARLGPDLLLVMFFENDLSDNCLSYYAGFGPRPYARMKNGEVEMVERLEPQAFLRFTLPVPFRFELSRHSYLYYFLNTEVYQRLFGTRMREMQRADLRQAATCGDYQIFSSLIARLKSEMRARGGEFAVVLIPTREDVAAGSSKAEEPILKFCRDAAVNCLPLLDRFLKERASGARLYFDNDIHWTKVGHRVAADEIGRYLAKLEGPRAAGLSAPPDPRARPAPGTRLSPSGSAASTR
jgi:lysophospholipase L1-like esterase